MEGFRRTTLRRFWRNAGLAKRPDFALRVRAFLIAHHVRVVRIHVGGDFYSAEYAATWLAIIRRSRRVRFFFYTRSWRVAAIKDVIDRMAAEPNCQAWYSCDKDTGVPQSVSADVRLAWLMTDERDEPPAGTHLVFRVHRLRRQAAKAVAGVPVCAAEDGVARRQPMTCDRCGVCWRPPEPAVPKRVSLPILDEPSNGTPVNDDDAPASGLGGVPVGAAPGRSGR